MANRRCLDHADPDHSRTRAVSDLTSIAGLARSYHERPEAEARLAATRDAFPDTDPHPLIAGTETIERSVGPRRADLAARTI